MDEYLRYLMSSWRKIEIADKVLCQCFILKSENEDIMKEVWHDEEEHREIKCLLHEGLLSKENVQFEMGRNIHSDEAFMQQPELPVINPNDYISNERMHRVIGWLSSGTIVLESDNHDNHDNHDNTNGDNYNSATESGSLTNDPEISWSPNSSYLDSRSYAPLSEPYTNSWSLSNDGDENNVEGSIGSAETIPYSDN